MFKDLGPKRQDFLVEIEIGIVVHCGHGAAEAHIDGFAALSLYGRHHLGGVVATFEIL